VAIAGQDDNPQFPGTKTSEYFGWNLLKPFLRVSAHFLACLIWDATPTLIEFSTLNIERNLGRNWGRLKVGCSRLDVPLRISGPVPRDGFPDRMFSEFPRGYFPSGFQRVQMPESIFHFPFRVSEQFHRSADFLHVRVKESPQALLQRFQLIRHASSNPAHLWLYSTPEFDFYPVEIEMVRDHASADFADLRR
jgi:hypothetical protein